MATAEETQSATYGIRLGMTYAFSSTNGFAQNPNMQIWRTSPSTSNGALPSTDDWTILTTLSPNPTVNTPYTDTLPNDGERRFYRARHTQAGFSPSIYFSPAASTQTWVSAIPTQLSGGGV